MGLEGQNSDIFCVMSHVHAGPRLTEQSRTKPSVFLELLPYIEEYWNNSVGESDILIYPLIFLCLFPVVLL